MLTRILAAAAALAASTSPAWAAQAELPARKLLPADVLLDIGKAAVADCAAKGHPVAVAILDTRGELRLLVSSPDVSPISIKLSQRKARTAALFGGTSGEVGARFRANAAYGQAMMSVDPELSGAAGAVPIRVGGQVIGAVGISGAPGGDVDEACATAGLKAVEARLK